MSISRGPSVSRLKTIMRRQNLTTWDADYVPAILATRGEAPSISHAITITSKKVPGRDVHLLSLPETFAALLGLYHPDVVGLQEQRLLSPGPKQHPLHNFPTASSQRFLPLKGMIDVAERLGYLSMLPRVRVDDPEQPGLKREVVFPYVGDLLWAIRGSTGRHYCVNWSVKDSDVGFKRPLQHERFVTPSKKAANGLLARHEMECAYYADAGIRTVQVAGDTIDVNIRANLRHLFLHHSREVAVTAQERLNLLERFQNCIDVGTPPFELIARLAGGGKYSVDDCRNILFQGIWNRVLKVDLKHPILIDRPLHPQSEDIIARYGDWFTEVTC